MFILLKRINWDNVDPSVYILDTCNFKSQIFFSEYANLMDSLFLFY